MKILIAGGGSIGHIAPGVAVARALLHLQPDATIRFVCAKREEEESFLDSQTLSHAAITLPRLRLRSPLAFPKAWREARTIVSDFAPDVVFCKGGSVSVPVALAARRRGIPIVLHESDAVSGRANRLIAHFAKTVCLSFPHTRFAADNSKFILTGNPVRPEMTRGDRAKALALTGFSGTRPVLLVIGGSQGAEALNRIVIGLLPSLLHYCDVAHVTGRGKSAAPSQPSYWSAPFVGEDYPHLFALASLALSRSGANAVAELAACAVPSLFVPLEGVAQDHQRANAQAACTNGGCILLEQRALQASLIPTVQSLLADSALLKKMSAKMQTLARPDAAETIAKAILETRGE